MLVLAGILCVCLTTFARSATSAAPEWQRHGVESSSYDGLAVFDGGHGLLAQSSSSSGTQSGSEGGGEGETFGGARNSLTIASTTVIADGLRRAAEICETAGEAARVGCLAQEIAKVADEVPPGIEYRGIRIELNKVAKDLDRVVRSNGAADTPASPSGYGQVAEEHIVRATAEALEVIDEAQTRLLRSSEGSRLRRTHYVRVARSFESSKRILRSS